MEDYTWFEKTILRVVAEDLNEEKYVPLAKPLVYFGDFLRYCVRKKSLLEWEWFVLAVISITGYRSV